MQENSASKWHALQPSFYSGVCSALPMGRFSLARSRRAGLYKSRCHAVATINRAVTTKQTPQPRPSTINATISHGSSHQRNPPDGQSTSHLLWRISRDSQHLVCPQGAHQFRCGVAADRRARWRRAAVQFGERALARGTRSNACDRGAPDGSEGGASVGSSGSETGNTSAWLT